MRRLLLLPPALFLLAFLVYPLASVVSSADADGWRWVTIPYVRDRLAIALLQATVSAGLALLAASPLVLLHHHRAFAGERFLLALHAAPFVLPVFVIVFGLQATLFPRIPGLGPFGSVVLANAYYNYGFAARLLLGHLQRRPHGLEEAARTLGSSRWGAFRRASLPLLAGPIASVALLVFLWCLASFGVVFLLGAGKVDTFETLLYSLLRGIYPRVGRAAVLALMQVMLAFLLLGLVLAARRRGRHLPAYTPHQRRPLGLAATLAAWGIGIAAITPVLSILAGGFRMGGAWSLEPWRAILDPAHPAHLGTFDLGRTLAYTAFYAFTSTALALLLAAAVAYGSRRHALLRRPAEVLASAPLGISTVVLGFGFLLAFGAGDVLDLRASPALVLLSHTMLAFPFVCRVVLPALESVDPRMEEAARVLGASEAGVAWRIHMPMLRAPVLAATGFAIALSLGDLGSSLLLMSPDSAGLAYWVNAHRGFNPLVRAQSVALAGLLGLLAVGAYSLTQRVEVRT